MLKPFMAIIFAALTFSCSYAEEKKPDVRALMKAATEKGAPRTVTVPAKDPYEMKPMVLPMKGMMGISKNGQMKFLSLNGRFLIQGTVIDRWNENKPLANIQDVIRASTHIDLDKHKINLSDLDPFIVGEGKRVVVYVDPFCPGCKQFFEEVGNIKGYQFVILPVPVLGRPSSLAVRKLGCAADKKEAMKVLLSADSKQYQTLMQTKDCNPEGMQKRLLSSDLLGVIGVPYFIRPDGLIGKGYPKEGLSKWLKKP